MELLQIVEGAKKRQSKLAAHASHEDAVKRGARSMGGSSTISNITSSL